MNRLRPQGSLDRGAAPDLWRHTLCQIPSLFGRLVYLCSLRDQNSGRYEHFGLAQLFSEEEADRALRQSHLECFAEWLSYSLEQLKADLDLYLAGLDGNRRMILETWIRVAPYRNLIPAAAREMERQLYLADLETILVLLKNEYGVASLDPDA